MILFHRSSGLLACTMLTAAIAPALINQRVHGTGLEFLVCFYGIEWESGWFDADLVHDCPGSLLLHHEAHREGLCHGFDS